MADDERTHWQRWHDDYADPSSVLSRRLAVVQARLRTAIASSAPGPITLISACAGEGRDVLGVLDGHPRAADISGRLVELDPGNADRARRLLDAAGLRRIEVVTGDAGTLQAYAGAVPADIVLLCGIFGNVADSDVERTARNAAQLCATGATLIWTRHRRDPDLTPAIRRWFDESGFAEIAFDSGGSGSFGVGTQRFLGHPPPLERSLRLFSFD